MSLPIRITVNTPAGEVAYRENEVTHVTIRVIEEGKVLLIYDGATLIKEYQPEEWIDWEREEMEPVIEDYKGPGFPE